MVHPTLDIAVCTYRKDGIERFAATNPPRIEGVRYILSWQARDGAKLPEALNGRDDIVVVEAPGYGLSLNRNNALKHCTAEFILIADDDVEYNAEGINRAIEAMRGDSDLALATFIVPRPSSPRYPAASCVLGQRMPRGYWVVSFEIMLRRKLVADLCFDTRLGIGAERMTCGEEEVFVLTARRRGLLCKFFPIEIGKHPHQSTGSKASPSIFRANGCVMALEFGRVKCIPRLWLKAWRAWRTNGANPLTTLVYLHQGLMASRNFRV